MEINIQDSKERNKTHGRGDESLLDVPSKFSWILSLVMEAFARGRRRWIGGERRACVWRENEEECGQILLFQKLK